MNTYTGLIGIHGCLFGVSTINRIITDYEKGNPGLGLKILFRTDRCGYPCLTGYIDLENKRIVPYDEYCSWESYERDMLKPFVIPCKVLERDCNLSRQQIQAFNQDSLENGFGLNLIEAVCFTGQWPEKRKS